MPVSIGLIAQTIERIAPKSWAEDWDNVGLLVGNASTPVERVLLTLDGTLEVVQEAKDRKAQLILAHHPIMFRPLKNLRSDNLAARIPIELVRSGISYYAAHTNLDQSSFSSSWTIGKALGLQKMDYLTLSDSERLVKLIVYVPRTHVEKVRQALVKVGVGEGITDGPHGANYSESFFATDGIGMFRPLEGAEPTLGKIGELTRVEETRLESIIPERLVDRTVKALKSAHPYEEPAFDLIPLRNNGRPRGYGVIGYLRQPESLERIRERVLEGLKESAPQSVKFSDVFGVRSTGDSKREIRKVAIANGSGGSFVPKALYKGADLLITGDVDHHAALDALEAGMSILDIGHFWSEIPMISTLFDYLRADKALGSVELLLSQSMSAPWVL
jgi:dinuclear metal center YbgI/SA1388 family protein